VKSTGYPLHPPVPLHFPSRASPCAITFQLETTYTGIIHDSLLSRLLATLQIKYPPVIMELKQIEIKYSNPGPWARGGAVG